jgi:hypothetical protein
MTAQFAPVAPLRVLAQLEDSELGAGNYHLVIVNEVANDIFRYAAFFNTLRAKHGPIDIILDNGVVETGTAAAAGMMAAIGRAIGSYIHVLPDVLGDMKSTIRATQEARKLYEDVSPFKFMGVAQGSTFDEFLECAREINGYVDFLAVPRLAVGKVGSRVELVRAIAQFDKPIHLLGFSDNIQDDFQAVHASDLVMGIDSAMPIWMGQNGFKVADWGNPEVSHPRSRPDGYWRDEVVNTRVLANIRKVRSWLNDAKDAPIQVVPAEPEAQLTHPSPSSEKPQAQPKSGQVSPSSAPPANSSKQPSSGLVRRKSRS